jgi:hypothetical protein
MLIFSSILNYLSLDPNREKGRRGRTQVVSKLHATKRPSKVNRHPGRKPGFRFNVRGSNIKTYHTGKMKLQTDVHVKDLYSVTSSICRGGIMLSAGEEVVRHIHLSHRNAVSYR